MRRANGPAGKLGVAFAVSIAVGGGLRMSLPESVGSIRNARAVAVVDSTEVVVTEEPNVTPTLHDVLEARGSTRVVLLGTFLPGATIFDLESIARVLRLPVPGDQLSAIEQVMWRMVLARWVALDPKSALAMEAEIDDWGVKGYCYRTWAESDWQAAAASADSESGELRFAAIASVCDQVVANDIERARRWCDEYPRSNLVHSLAGALARKGTAEALAWVVTLPEVIRAEASWAVFRVLAQQDADGAFEMIATLDSPALRTSAERGFVSALVEHDPVRAEQHIGWMPPSKARTDLHKQLATHYARNDPDATMRWAKSLPDSVEKNAAIAIAAIAQSKGNTGRILSILDEIGWQHTAFDPSSISKIGGGQSYDTNHSLRKAALDAIVDLARTDRLGALQYLGKIVPDETLSVDYEFARAVAPGWFRDDPESFLAGVEASPSESLQRRMLSEVLGKAMSDDIAFLKQRAPDMSANLQKHLAIRMAGRLLEDDGAMETFSWLRSLDEPARMAGGADILRIVAATEPVLALDYLDFVEPGDSRFSMLGTAIDHLKSDEIGDAVLKLPIELMKPQQFSELASKWFKSDPMATSQWIAGLPPGKNRDQAARSLVDDLIQYRAPDFNSALAWANSINDPEEKELAYRKVFPAWLAVDDSRASRALDKLDVPEERKPIIRTPWSNPASSNFNIGYEF
ncbi:MAG: hypothetical protein KDN22_22415 [Verrucomicrobiae bacterium]|nr:hypothetical protein [Verrucomicrobiae bacterium]